MPLLQVSQSTLRDFDLLRRRRQELALPAFRQVSSRDLVLRGALIAALQIMVAGMLWTGMALYESSLQRREESLRPVAEQHQQLEAQLSTLGQKLTQKTKANQDLANAIASISASSVLMVELADLTPPGVQLSTAVQQGPQLTLTGLAVPPHALRAINALQLKLEGSPLFNPSQVQIVKLIEQTEGGKNATAASKQPNNMSFEIKATFIPSARASLALLQSRGAAGLLRRLQLVEQEGLLQ
jgi:Tfp pilus assembly protein PilN